jgi:hypothetical protein
VAGHPGGEVAHVVADDAQHLADAVAELEVDEGLVELAAQRVAGVLHLACARQRRAQRPQQGGQCLARAQLQFQAQLVGLGVVDLAGPARAADHLRQLPDQAVHGLAGGRHARGQIAQFVGHGLRPVAHGATAVGFDRRVEGHQPRVARDLVGQLGLQLQVGQRVGAAAQHGHHRVALLEGAFAGGQQRVERRGLDVDRGVHRAGGGGGRKALQAARQGVQRARHTGEVLQQLGQAVRRHVARHVHLPAPDRHHLRHHHLGADTARGGRRRVARRGRRVTVRQGHAALLQHKQHPGQRHHGSAAQRTPLPRQHGRSGHRCGSR